MFGSKKRRQDMHAKSAHDISGISASDIRTAEEMTSRLGAQAGIASASASSSASFSASTGNSSGSPLDSQLPPYDVTATDAEDVFDLSDVLTREVLGE